MSKQQKGYAVVANTGCSCDSCKQEFFIELFFTDDPVPTMETAERYASNGRVRSQYSKTGIYHVKEFQYEKLEDGRKVIGKYITDIDDKDFESVILENNDSHFIDYQTNWKALATYGSYLPQEKW